MNNEDPTLHYNISDILLKTCDMNKIADFVERAELIEREFDDRIGPNEQHFVKSTNEGMVEDQEKLLELKSRAWDEIFRLNSQKNAMNKDWMATSFGQFVHSTTYAEIRRQQDVIDDWKNKRTLYKNMCLQVSDLLADYTYFLGRDNHDSHASDQHAIHVPGVIKLSSVTDIYSELSHSSVVPIMDTLKKLKKNLIDRLHSINCEIKHAKSASFDIVHDSCSCNFLTD